MEIPLVSAWRRRRKEERNNWDQLLHSAAQTADPLYRTIGQTGDPLLHGALTAEQARDRFNAHYSVTALRTSRQASKALVAATWALVTATTVLAAATIILAVRA